MKQPVDVGLRDVSKLLCQSGLYHVPLDPVVLCEQVIQQPTVLQEEKCIKQLKRIVRHFGKYTNLLSRRELDKTIDTSFLFVNLLISLA